MMERCVRMETHLVDLPPLLGLLLHEPGIYTRHYLVELLAVGVSVGHPAAQHAAVVHTS